MMGQAYRMYRNISTGWSTGTAWVAQAIDHCSAGFGNGPALWPGCSDAAGLFRETAILFKGGGLG